MFSFYTLKFMQIQSKPREEFSRRIHSVYQAGLRAHPFQVQTINQQLRKNRKLCYKNVRKWQKQVHRPKSSCLSPDKNLIGGRACNALSGTSRFVSDMMIMIFQD